MNKVLVFGAGGRLGSEIVAALLVEGFSVTACVRNPDRYVAPTTVRVIKGDAMDAASVKLALEGQCAVVNAIGAGTLRKNKVESQTTSILLRALCESRVRRYVGMSAGMVEVGVLPLGMLAATVFRLLLVTLFRNIREEHRAVEKLIRDTNLDWTIIRPPRLTSGQLATDYSVSTKHIIPGAMSVSCATVARFIASELRQNRFVRKAVFIG